MPSEVSICNLALGWLGKNPITALTDSSKEAVLCNQNYALARDAVLADAEWTFAVKRLALPVSGTSPVYEYGTQFLIPDEVIRMLEINQLKVSGRDMSGPNWQVEGKYLVTNESSANVRAIVRVTDPATFSPEFIRALSARLAADMCMALTNSKSREEQLEVRYTIALRKAKTQDGRQGSNRRLRSSWLKKARAGGGGGFAGPYV